MSATHTLQITEHIETARGLIANAATKADLREAAGHLHSAVKLILPAIDTDPARVFADIKFHFPAIVDAVNGYEH